MIISPRLKILWSILGVIVVTCWLPHVQAQEASATPVDDRAIPDMIEQWLADYPTDLFTVPFLTINNYVFAVQPLGNNTPAFSLIVRQAPSNGMAFYRVGLSGDAASYIAIEIGRNKYQIPTLPAPMFGAVVAVGDFNADHQPDFAYETYDHVGNNYTSGSLYVVTWTGKALQLLSQIGFRYGAAGYDPAMTWQFVDLNRDDKQEIVQTQRFSDNWGCEFIRISYHGWKPDGSLYFESSQDDLPKSFACLMRQAEQSAWATRYSEAIDLYQQALAKPDGDPELRIYAQMRLGLAYLITGETQKANIAFTSLSAPSDDTAKYQWVQTIREAYQHDPRLLPICQAIYDQALNIYANGDITGTVEVSDGGFYGAGAYDPGIDLKNLSCNLFSVMKSTLASTDFSTQETPVDQLQALGLKVSNSIQGDLDTDGDTDWLVWSSSLGIDPLLFIADGSQYTQTILIGMGAGDIIRTASDDLRPPDTFNQYSIIRLPDGTVALMDVDFGTVDQYIPIICGSSLCGGGPSVTCAKDDYAPDPASGMGDISLWRLEGQQLEPFFGALLCGWGYQANLFPDGEGGNTLLAGDQFALADESVEVRPVIYHWDASKRTYVAPDK